MIGLLMLLVFLVRSGVLVVIAVLGIKKGNLKRLCVNMVRGELEIEFK